MKPQPRRMTAAARELRREMTRQERRLWFDFLRGCPEKFYRQRVIGPYIVDFYCSRAALVIEIDGSQHYEPRGVEHDAERTRYLESQGLKVIRFTNTDVDTRFPAVCDAIIHELSRPNGSPARGAGAEGD